MILDYHAVVEQITLMVISVCSCSVLLLQNSVGADFYLLSRGGVESGFLVMGFLIMNLIYLSTMFYILIGSGAE